MSGPGLVSGRVYNVSSRIFILCFMRLTLAYAKRKREKEMTTVLQTERKQVGSQVGQCPLAQKWILDLAPFFRS